MWVALNGHGPLTREELFGHLLAEEFGLRTIHLALEAGLRRGRIVATRTPEGLVTFRVANAKDRARRRVDDTKPYSTRSIAKIRRTRRSTRFSMTSSFPLRTRTILRLRLGPSRGRLRNARTRRPVSRRLYP